MLKLYAAISGAALALATSGALAQGAIATADGEQSGVRIDITCGDTVTMRFTLVNESGETVNPYDLFESVQSDVRNVYLIDAAGRKKYLTIMDATNNCVCSGGLSHSLDNGKSTPLWARFPAPPAQVKEVSAIFPHFIPADVPISE